MGRGYMGGGALGLVSLGRAEAGDNRGLTLNIRHQVRGESIKCDQTLNVTGV